MYVAITCCFFVLIFVVVVLTSSFTNWRAREASETLSEVAQLKIGDVCLFLYMCGRMHVILYFDPHVFVFASWSIPSHTSTKLNLLV